jgi:hypothetical protein
MQIIDLACLLLAAGTAVAADLPIVDLGYQRHQAIGFNVSFIPVRKKKMKGLEIALIM